MSRAGFVAAAVACLAAVASPPAHAQAGADPIDALLRAGRSSSAADAPVFLDETGKTPDGPATASDEAYDGGVLASMAAAQRFLGALDGGWTISAAGHDLYALQLSDQGGVVEGAWRDLRRPGDRSGSGLIDQAERSGPELTLRFGSSVAAMRSISEGRWAGRLTEAGHSQAAVMRRRNP